MPKATDIVERAATLCSSAEFKCVFDSFTRENADVFVDAVEAKGGGAEHKHEYKELFDRYMQLFEDELSEFIASEGSTINEFLRECRGVIDGHYTALFEEHEHAWFVDHLLASMDYKHFYELMVNEARRLHRK